MPKVILELQAIAACTPEQLDAIKRLTTNSGTLTGLHVQKGGFDLPDGYLAFRQDWEHGSSIYGGIAPDGAVST